MKQLVLPSLLVNPCMAQDLALQATGSCPKATGSPYIYSRATGAVTPAPETIGAAFFAAARAWLLSLPHYFKGHSH